MAWGGHAPNGMSISQYQLCMPSVHAASKVFNYNK